MVFKPETKQKVPEKSVLAQFNTDVVERNQKWMMRRDEKLSRLMAEQELSVQASCSFKPNIVDLF